MKRKVMLFGVILVLGLLALGCGDAGGTPTGPDVVSIWEKTGATLTLYSDNTFQFDSEEEDFSGTYTLVDSTITLTSNGATVGTGIIAGNKLTIDQDVFTKQGGSSGSNPYVGTTWTRTNGTNIQKIIFDSNTNYHITDNENPGENVSGTYTTTDTGVSLSYPGVGQVTGTVDGNTMTVGGDPYHKQ